MKPIQMILSVTILLLILSGCGNQKTQNNDIQKDTATTESTTDNQQNSTNVAKDSNNAQKKDNTITNSTTSSQSTTNENSLKEKVIDYIINGQGDKSDAEKIKWSESFLNEVDIDVLYNQYIVNGGISDNLEDFAKYITLSAPIPANWENLFKNDFSNRFGEKVIRLDLYKVIYTKHI